MSGNLVLYGVLSGGFLAGLVALFKFRPERDQAIVSYSKDAVLIHRDLMQELRLELERSHELNGQLERSLASLREELLVAKDENVQLRLRVSDLERELEVSKVDRCELRERVSELRDEVGRLRSEQPH